MYSDDLVIQLCSFPQHINNNFFLCLSPSSSCSSSSSSSLDNKTRTTGLTLRIYRKDNKAGVGGVQKQRKVGDHHDDNDPKSAHTYGSLLGNVSHRVQNIS